ncbi:DUF2141 domain-containing protein [uncultured Sphingomonas sp.]|uniref:DUF2141 domain-containing protein n=1 Tax=uncultured Sphingomonas sp. TaxID=158754 RepID=UPI0025FA0141|nr:DUF2141 domain-containing protein [uncultured Sphingomonas sp.]
MIRPLFYTAAGLAALLGSALLVPNAAAQACAGTSGAGKTRLSVTATEIRNAHGEMVFTLYPDDSSRFLAKGGKLARVRTPAQAPATTACFWVTPGSYAVATYHDENGDHDFNRTLFTIKEGFGFSNDAPTTLGLPSLSRVRFPVPAGGASIRVRTRYSR